MKEKRKNQKIWRETKKVCLPERINYWVNTSGEQNRQERITPKTDILKG